MGERSPDGAVNLRHTTQTVGILHPRIASKVRSTYFTIAKQITKVLGYRLLAGIPRVPPAVLDRLIQHFGNLQGLLAATAADLQAVEGVGEARARVVREGLSRLAESSIVDRYGSAL